MFTTPPVTDGPRWIRAGATGALTIIVLDLGRMLAAAIGHQDQERDLSSPCRDLWPCARPATERRMKPTKTIGAEHAGQGIPPTNTRCC